MCKDKNTDMNVDGSGEGVGGCGGSGECTGACGGEKSVKEILAEAGVPDSVSGVMVDAEGNSRPLSHEDLLGVLSSVASSLASEEDEDEDSQMELSLPEKVTQLEEAFAFLGKPSEPFKKGDVVVFKPHCNLVSQKTSLQPYKIVKVLDVPVECSAFPSKGGRSIVGNVLVDLEAVFVDNVGDLIPVYLSSERMELVSDALARQEKAVAE
jgi:hypothetical protein